MRVLQVYRTYFPDTQGGIEETIRQICRNTIPYGVESRVFSLSKNPVPGIVNQPEAEVHRFPLSFEIASCGFTGRGILGFMFLAKWADIIHYHFPWPFADLLHLIVQVKQPTLLTYQSDIIRQKTLLKIYKPLMHFFLNKVDCIVSTSSHYYRTSTTLCQFKEKMKVIPIGLDRNSYPKISESKLQAVRAQVGEDFFLFIGVLRYYKGLHILLEAISDSKFQVVIVGSGPEDQRLKNLAGQLGLDNVRFLGYVSDEEKVALIHLSRALILPSCFRSEAFGVTLLEGAMYGKPLISTELGTGTSYININGETGYVVLPGNPRELRNAMERMFRDPVAAKRMGQAAKNRYEKLFTGERMGKKYANLYKDLLVKKFNESSQHSRYPS